jgi:Ni/Co efflux regulator RcnB
MKTFLSALAILTLCAASAAEAQSISITPRGNMARSDRDNNRDNNNAQPRGAFQRGAPAPQAAPQAAPQPQAQAQPQARGERGGRRGGGRSQGGGNPNAAAQALADQNAIANQNAARNAERGRATPGRDNDRTGAFQRGGNDRFASQNAGERRGRDVRNNGNGRNDRRAGRVERNSRYGYSRDYSGRRFNYHGRNFYSVRAPAFRYPRGWGYRRWSIGAFLPELFLGTPYYIDYDWIGLPPPDYGERWVRYGPDALLVDEYNGEVVDVVYNVFY